jgi:uncharacterized membrane protein YphA (DoxX/SURF4 family)
MNTQLTGITMALRIAFGLMATLAGLDKFFNLLADWEAYIAPVAVQLSPLAPATLMGLVGLVEIGVGLTILAIHPTIGAYVASAWLSLVALNLVMGGHFDVAVRDLVLAVAAFALASLSELTAAARHPQRVSVSESHSRIAV